MNQNLPIPKLVLALRIVCAMVGFVAGLVWKLDPFAIHGVGFAPVAQKPFPIPWFVDLIIFPIVTFLALTAFLLVLSKVHAGLQKFGAASVTSDPQIAATVLKHLGTLSAILCFTFSAVYALPFGTTWAVFLRINLAFGAVSAAAALSGVAVLRIIGRPSR